VNAEAEARRRVLVVEDEEPIRDLLSFHLKLGGFDCVTLGDGRQALERLQAEPFDLLVLDISLPGLDGLSLCRAVRRTGPNMSIPIIMLTARGEESDKVLGLEGGADDYVTKPFSVREFMARTSAIMRRREGWGPEPPLSTRRIISASGVTIDPAKRRVTCDGREPSLTPQEFGLLYLLASNPGVVFTREELLEKVWDQEVFVTERGVDTLVKRLRRKIETDPAHPSRVLTERGTGYKFREA
jgi:two-component system OmpR family response regulator/two-component system alkaline phosphatase synthesis response regulator PhoP